MSGFVLRLVVLEQFAFRWLLEYQFDECLITWSCCWVIIGNKILSKLIDEEKWVFDFIPYVRGCEVINEAIEFGTDDLTAPCFFLVKGFIEGRGLE